MVGVIFMLIFTKNESKWVDDVVFIGNNIWGTAMYQIYKRYPGENIFEKNGKNTIKATTGHRKVIMIVYYELMNCQIGIW